jgi:uncharacterized protein (TIGR03067 family)
MNPAGIDLICMSYEEGGKTTEVFFSPFDGWFAFPETRNARVAEWFEAIRGAVLAATGREPTRAPAERLRVPSKTLATILLMGVPVAVLAILLGAINRMPGGQLRLDTFFLQLSCLVVLFAGAWFGPYVWSRWARKERSSGGGAAAWIACIVMALGVVFLAVFSLLRSRQAVLDRPAEVASASTVVQMASAPPLPPPQVIPARVPSHLSLSVRPQEADFHIEVLGADQVRLGDDEVSVSDLPAALLAAGFRGGKSLNVVASSETPHASVASVLDVLREVEARVAMANPLKGTWRVVEQVLSGRKRGEVSNAPLIFVGAYLLDTQENAAQRLRTVRVVSDSQPKRLDISDHGSEMLAIYRFDGPRLLISINRNDPSSRPKGFFSGPENSIEVTTLERVDVPPSPAPSLTPTPLPP